MPVMNTESIFPSDLSAAFGCGLTGCLAERTYRWNTCIEVRTYVILSLFPVNFCGFLGFSAALIDSFPVSLSQQNWQ